MRFTIATIAFCLITLGACDFSQMTMFDAGSVILTEKTVGDHIISLGSGKDCSSVRTEKGMTYCKEDEIELVPAVYCYPSLGDVTCYGQPDPYQTKKAAIGGNEHNMVRQAKPVSQ